MELREANLANIIKRIALCVLYYLAGKYLTSVHCKIFDLNIIISSEAGD